MLNTTTTPFRCTGSPTRRPLLTPHQPQNPSVATCFVTHYYLMSFPTLTTQLTSKLYHSRSNTKTNIINYNNKQVRQSPSTPPCQSTNEEFELQHLALSTMALSTSVQARVVYPITSPLDVECSPEHKFSPSNAGAGGHLLCLLKSRSA